jgi:hypothetical protein
VTRGAKRGSGAAGTPRRPVRRAADGSNPTVRRRVIGAKPNHGSNYSQRNDHHYHDRTRRPSDGSSGSEPIAAICHFKPSSSKLPATSYMDPSRIRAARMHMGQTERLALQRKGRGRSSTNSHQYKHRRCHQYCPHRHRECIDSRRRKTMSRRILQLPAWCSRSVAQRTHAVRDHSGLDTAGARSESLGQSSHQPNSSLEARSLKDGPPSSPPAIDRWRRGRRWPAGRLGPRSLRGPWSVLTDPGYVQEGFLAMGRSAH